MDFIVKHRVFGETHCWMYPIEWKHILIWLSEKVTPGKIYQVISEEIPDIDIDPDLFEVVTKQMIHGPCGLLNNDSPCISDGKCTKRDFHADTITGSNGYGGKSITLKVEKIIYSSLLIRIIISFFYNYIEVDNRWVVPYSPLLSKTFKAHNSVKAIKYICKYVNKGSDMAVIGIGKCNSTLR